MLHDSCKAEREPLTAQLTLTTSLCCMRSSSSTEGSSDGTTWSRTEEKWKSRRARSMTEALMVMGEEEARPAMI